ncbi:MAG: ABC transporter substrate-binding protein [Chloroflexi bacterium]|nr:ABC transporter substrate-binding protein [Chloroflexota bacterium]
MTLHRRRLLRLAGGAVAIGLLAACTSAAPGTSPVTPGAPATSAAAPPPASTAAAQPVQGGTLQIGTISDITQLEAHRLMGQNWNMLYPIFDRLTEYDDTLVPQPRLAQSWEFSSDNKTLQLHLRQGVQFHTGRELTADDVKYNITRARDPKTGAAQMVTMGNWWTDIQTPDKYTVVLVSDQARPAAFDFLEYLNIIDSVTAEGPNAATTLVGTGPFTLTEWVTGDHLSLARNPHYWQSAGPYLDQVIFHIGRDQQALITQLEAGAIDAMDAPPVTDAVRLKADPAYTLTVNPNTGGYNAVLANTSVPPLDNVQVRQALNYAINRQRFVDSVLLGIGTAGDLVWPAGSPAYEADKINRYAFDLDRAKQMLAAAGIASPTLDLTYIAANAAYAQLAQILQADLASIGVTANLQPVEPAVWSQITPKAQYQGLNLAPGGFAQVQPTSFFLFSVYWQLQNNAEAFQSDQFGQLLTAAGTEPDPTRRKQLYSQLNDFVLDQSFVMLVNANPETFLTRGNVHGQRYNMHQGLVMDQLWKS